MPRTRSRAGDDSQQLTPQQIQQEINRKWPGAMKFASDEEFKITRIPCGILSLDVRLGGGFPRGRHIETYGSFNVGKTYVLYRLIASAQSRGMLCAFVDVEGTFDPSFAASCGVDLAALAIHRQEHGNRVIDFVETLLRSGLYAVIGIDSIAALLPQAELESDMEEVTYGTAQAKLMSKGLRKLTAANKTTVLYFINQTREAVGGSAFAKKTVTSGGKAMGYYAGVRLELVRTESIKANARRIKPENGEWQKVKRVKGHRVLVRVEKDKTGGAKTFAETTFVFDYDIGGADHIEDLIYLGRIAGFIHKRNATWWLEDYEDEKQAGRGKFKKWLRKNRAVAEELTQMIIDHFEGSEESESDEED